MSFLQMSLVYAGSKSYGQQVSHWANMGGLTWSVDVVSNDVNKTMLNKIIRIVRKFSILTMNLK